MRNEIGRVIKGNVTLIEYEAPDAETSNKFFLQCGVVGLNATPKELKDLYTVLNYYVNIENFSECNIRIGDDHVAIR